MGGTAVIGVGEMFRPDSFETVPDAPVVNMMFTVLGLGFYVTPIVVTWKWFTAREKRDQ